MLPNIQCFHFDPFWGSEERKHHFSEDVTVCWSNHLQTKCNHLKILNKTTFQDRDLVDQKQNNLGIMISSLYMATLLNQWPNRSCMCKKASHPILYIPDGSHSTACPPFFFYCKRRQDKPRHTVQYTVHLYISWNIMNLNCILLSGLNSKEEAFDLVIFVHPDSVKHVTSDCFGKFRQFRF